MICESGSRCKKRSWWWWQIMVGVGLAVCVLSCCFCGCCCCAWMRSDRDGFETARSGVKIGRYAIICERCSGCGRRRRWAPPVLPLHYRSFPRPEYLEPVLPTFSPPRRPLPPPATAATTTATPPPPEMFYNQEWFWKLMVGVGVALVVLICCCCGCLCYGCLRLDRDGLSAARSGLQMGRFAVICEKCSCCGRSRSWAPPVLPLHYRSFPRPDYIEPILLHDILLRRPLPPLPAPSNSDLLCHQPHHRHQ